MLKIKRKLSLALAVILIISMFAGCSSQKTEPESVKGGTTTTQTVSDKTEQATQDENKNESETKDKQTEDTTDKADDVNAASSASKGNGENKEKTSSKSSSESKTTQKKKASSTTAAKTTKKAENTVSTCTLTIECTAVLNNMSSLKAGHEKYVPGNGYILSNKKMTISKGDTVYDVLKEACSESGIRLTASNSSFGIYVSGINNIDEKDCGKNSGWTYWVNGNMPMVTCGKYNVNNGDEIKFSYVV